MVEYLLVVGLVALGVIFGFRSFGDTARTKALAQADCVANLEDCGASGNGQASAAAAADDGANGSTAGDGREIRGQAYSSDHGPLDGLVDFGRGFVSQAVDTVTGIWDVVTHPVETVEGLAWAATHPVETVQALGGALVDSWNRNPAEFLGRAAFEIVTLPAAIGKLSKIRTITATRDAAEAAQAARGLDKAADAAKAAEAAGAAGQASLRARVLERIRALRRGETVPDEPAFGWQDVNKGPAGGRTINCTRCTMAVDCTLGGAPSCAMPMRDVLGNATDDLAQATNTMYLPDLAVKMGLDPAAWQKMADKAALVQAVEAWGDGAKGIVGMTYVHNGQRAAHVFNVINDGGQVMFFEGQLGTLGDLNFTVDKIEDLQLLRSTNFSPAPLPQPLPMPMPLPQPPAP